MLNDKRDPVSQKVGDEMDTQDCPHAHPHMPKYTLKINKQKQKNKQARLWQARVCLESLHLGGRGRQLSECEASLVYRVSSRTTRAAHRNPVSKNKTKTKTK